MPARWAIVQASFNNCRRPQWQPSCRPIVCWKWRRSQLVKQPEYSSPSPTSYLESQWWRAVTLVARQHYTAYLSRAEPDEIIESALSFRLSDELHKKFRRKIQGLFSQWKRRALDDAERWFSNDFFKIAKSAGIHVEFKCHDPFALRDVLSKIYQLEWVPQVFDWLCGSCGHGECPPGGFKMARV
ncbi:hypothetical protein VTN31DRAFT_6960 [Thermomyces dupontii]|uniref:uncharacterized protein n=1 Tax=Talaromyces thermophilus TaxID=28565 RepID=UPI003744677B